MSRRRKAKPSLTRNRNNCATIRRCSPNCPTPAKVPYRKKEALGEAAMWRSRGKPKKAYKCLSGRSWHLTSKP